MALIELEMVHASDKDKCTVGSKITPILRFGTTDRL
jgi:hypothetical protein